MKEVIKMYDNIWNGMGETQVREAERILFDRFCRNGVNFELFQNKRVLDLGCGCGRYSIALKRLGAKDVVGIDPGEGKRFTEEGVSYFKSKITELPKTLKLFDFVFCNGVLHHTKDQEKGIESIGRTVKSGGWLWLYVAGKSKMWQEMDKIRSKVTFEDSQRFQKILKSYGFPANKVFLLTDIFFTQHRTYYTREEIKNKLEKQGFQNIRFLERGTDYDFTEKTFKKEPGYKFYETAEIRLLAQKK